MTEHVLACLGEMCGREGLERDAEIAAHVESRQLEAGAWPGSARVSHKPSAFPGLQVKAD